MITKEMLKSGSKITLKLIGTPIGKQSVRFHKGKAYVEKKYKKRSESYILQIKSQLPSGFKMFSKWCIVEYIKFVFPPLKSNRNKICNDEIVIYKTTKPDLQDNLNKLLFDAIEKAGVLSNDSIICRIESSEKIYQCVDEGYIEIKLIGN